MGRGVGAAGSVGSKPIQPSSVSSTTVSPSPSTPKEATPLSKETQASHARGASKHAAAKAHDVKQQSSNTQSELGKSVLSQKHKLGSQSSAVGSQVKYGPTADLTAAQQKDVQAHYGSKGQGPTQRLTQYEKDHSTYVKAAEQTGRGLTAQEAKAKSTGKNAPNASINHIIASGTGQNVLNEQTLQFGKGAKKVSEHYKSAVADPQKISKESIDAAQKETRAGIASQAAAVGRMQGYSREIIKERKGEKAGDKPFDVTAKRNEVLQKTLTAFQGDKKERFGAYKSVMKETFDSPGNLRVGDRSANTKISTGFDAPLDADGKPAARAKRLLHAHQTFAPDRLLTDDRIHTKDKEGNILSSSQEVDGPVSSRTRSKTKKAE